MVKQVRKVERIKNMVESKIILLIEWPILQLKRWFQYKYKKES